MTFRFLLRFAYVCKVHREASVKSDIPLLARFACERIASAGLRLPKLGLLRWERTTIHRTRLTVLRRISGKASAMPYTCRLRFRGWMRVAFAKREKAEVVTLARVGHLFLRFPVRRQERPWV